MRELTDHHDGHGLNDRIQITCDEKDPDAGNASHNYEFFTGMEDELFEPVAAVQFQHGPRNEEGSSPGVTEAAILVMLIDRAKSFQAGPYPCDENDRLVWHLQGALDAVKARVENRAKRGVLGHNEK